MKITIICDVHGEVNNGTILATTNLINYLRRKGHQVTVVSPDKETAGKEDYVVVPTLNLGKVLNMVVKKNGVTLAKADKEMMKIAMRDADVVHIQMPLLLGSVGAKLAQEEGKLLTASFHCQAENVTAHLGLMNSPRANKIVYRAFYHNVYNYCERIHYPTKFIRDLFEETVDKETPGLVISNGVNEMFFEKHEKIPHEKFVIVCSGRYSKEKAQWQLIEAIGKSKHKDEIHLILAGAGPFKNKLQKQASKLGVDMELTFFKRPDMITMLQNADLYVHSALIEIEAIACMEAIVCGLVPVICNSKRSATRAFALDERNLFEPKNTNDLAEHIDFWIENPDVMREYKEKYKTMADSFKLEHCMEQMEKMFIDLVEEYKR